LAEESRQAADNVVALDVGARRQRDRLLEALVRDHDTALRRFLRARLALEPDREDLLQEVYLRIVRHQDPQRIGQNPRAFLFTVATNLIQDRARRRSVRRESAHVPLESEEIPGAFTTEGVLEGRQALDAMRAVIVGLPEPCRRIFVKCRFEERSYREVAQSEGISVSMVEKHVSHALRALRSALEDSTCRMPE
jgi:RNA polymerase sigma factor (sigma-70 family)